MVFGVKFPLGQLHFSQQIEIEKCFPRLILKKLVKLIITRIYLILYGLVGFDFILI